VFLEASRSGEIRAGSNVRLSTQPGAGAAREDVGLCIPAAFTPIVDDRLLENGVEMG